MSGGPLATSKVHQATANFCGISLVLRHVASLPRSRQALADSSATRRSRPSGRSTAARLSRAANRSKRSFSHPPQAAQAAYAHHAGRLSDCRTQIAGQLRQALDKGAVDSPVAASINLAHLQGGNASRDRSARVTTVERVAGVPRTILNVVSDIEGQQEDHPRIDPEAVAELLDAIEDLDEVVARSDDKTLGQRVEPLRSPVTYLAHRVLGGEPRGSSRRARLQPRTTETARVHDQATGAVDESQKAERPRT